MRTRNLLGLVHWSVILVVAVWGNCYRDLAQTTDLGFDELKNKYTWGSIYFSYDPICDFIYDLKNPTRFKMIQSSDKHSVLPLLSDFFRRNMTGDRSRSISFLQINLIAQQAGYMNASDRDGAIRPLPWTKAQVLSVAMFCDRILTGQMSFQNLQDQILEGRIQLVDAWVGIQTLREDPFIPAEKISILLVSYRNLLEKKDSELAKIKIDNKVMFEQMSWYKKKFDDLDRRTVGAWRRDFVNAYYKDPYDSDLSGTLVRNEGSMMRAMSEWTIANSSSPSLVTALELYNAGADQAALDAVRSVIEVEPTSADAYLLRGRIQMRRGEVEDAVDSFKTAIFWDPKLIYAHISLGRIFLSQGNLGEATKYVYSSNSIDPTNEDAIRLKESLHGKPRIRPRTK